MADQITTHEADALARLLYQYRDSTNLKALVRLLCTDRVQEIENILAPFASRLDIDTQTGVQLDNIGALVGRSRISLNDAVFRLFIKAVIGKNVSVGDIPRILSVWSLISAANKIQLVEIYPGEVDLYYDVEIPSGLVDYAFNLIQDVVAGGVRVGFIAVMDLTEGFGFEGNPTALGFGDVTDPALGGKLSYIQNLAGLELLYENPFFGFDPADPNCEGFSSTLAPSTGGKLPYLNPL